MKRPQICAAIISNIPFIFVINKNILNRKAPAVKYDHKASSGEYTARGKIVVKVDQNDPSAGYLLRYRPNCCSVKMLKLWDNTIVITFF